MKTTLARNALAATALVTTLFAENSVAVADDAPPTTAFCNGGAQEVAFHITRNAPVSKAGANVQPIPFTQLAGGPSGVGDDADTYTVTFSAEVDGTVPNSFWTAQAQVSVNGGAFQDINPVGPNTILTGTNAQTHTMTWCKRLVATNTTLFRIVWAKIGGGVATVDDFLTRVERSN